MVFTHCCIGKHQKSLCVPNVHNQSNVHIFTCVLNVYGIYSRSSRNYKLYLYPSIIWLPRVQIIKNIYLRQEATPTVSQESSFLIINSTRDGGEISC